LKIFHLQLKNVYNKLMFVPDRPFQPNLMFVSTLEWIILGMLRIYPQTRMEIPARDTGLLRTYILRRKKVLHLSSPLPSNINKTHWFLFDKSVSDEEKVSKD